MKYKQSGFSTSITSGLTPGEYTMSVLTSERYTPESNEVKLNVTNK